MSLEENKKGHKSHLCTNKNEDVLLVENRTNMGKYMYKITFKIFSTCRIGYQEEVCVQNRSQEERTHAAINTIMLRKVHQGEVNKIGH